MGKEGIRIRLGEILVLLDLAVRKVGKVSGEVTIVGEIAGV